MKPKRYSWALTVSQITAVSVKALIRGLLGPGGLCVLLSAGLAL